MAAYNYQWSSEWMDQPSAAGVIGQLQAQLAELERKVNTFESRSSQNIYYQQQPSTIPNYYHLEWQNYQDYPWSDKYSESSYTPDYLYPSPHPPVQKTNLEEILERFLERTEARTNQDNYAPSPSYSPLQSQEPDLEYPIEPLYPSSLYEFSYQQPPQPQEEKLNLEEVLAKFMAGTEEFMARTKLRMHEQDNMLLLMDMNARSQPVEIENLENSIAQPANADYYLQYALPSITEINPKEEGNEQCKAEILSDDEEAYEVVDQDLEHQTEQEASAFKDQSFDSLLGDIEVNPRREGEDFGYALTLQNGEETHVAVGGSLKRSHPDMEVDSEATKKMIENGGQEKTNHEVSFKIFKTVNIPDNREECFRINVVKDAANESDDGSYFLPIDEDEFGDDSQFHTDAKEIEEKMNRRHAMTIFAIEPD